MNLIDSLLESMSELRKKIVVKIFDKYYQDLQDYISTEPNWIYVHHDGLALSFPYDRERLFIVVDGAPIGVQEGNNWQVNTKGYQFAHACRLAQKGVNVYCVHNHPGGDPTPSEMDFLLAKNFPEISYFTVAIDSNGVIEKRFYDKDGIISAGCLLNESNA